MNAMQGTMLSVAMALSSVTCAAQDIKVPFRQIERDARNPELSASVEVPGNESTVGHAYEMLSGSSSSAGFVLAPPAAKTPRTLSKGFFLLNGMHLGMAVFDVEMTQHCIANHHCVEGNPLMPSSQAGQLGVNFATVGLGAFLSYKMKEQDSGTWAFSPVVGIAAHAVGVATGFAHR
jgi:hypothetical protein